MSSNSKKKSLNFESTLSEIEKIIESLEEGNLSLEDSIEAYEKGISLTKACQKMLSDAELKIKKLSSKEGEGITDEMIACIKTEGAGESTGRLIGTSIGTKAAPAVSQVPIVGWLAAGWVAMLGGNKGAEVGGEVAKSFNDC